MYCAVPDRIAHRVHVPLATGRAPEGVRRSWRQRGFGFVGLCAVSVLRALLVRVAALSARLVYVTQADGNGTPNSSSSRRYTLNGF